MSRQSAEVPSRTFKAGDVIFKEGDDAKSEAFLVHEGKVEIRKQFGAEDRLLGVLGKGQLLGELALFRNAPRSATAIAAEPVTLLHIPAHRLEALMRVNPSLAMAIVKDLSGRMLAAEERAREAEKRAGQVEHGLLQMDPAKLAWDQQDSLRTVQGFLAKALEAVQTMLGTVDGQGLGSEIQQRIDGAEPLGSEAEDDSEGKKA
jgi:CRP-like cAMP-binding protein